jgi:hypothetical protein
LAAAIAAAIEQPPAEVYTNPVLHGMAVQYVQDVAAFERRGLGTELRVRFFAGFRRVGVPDMSTVAAPIVSARGGLEGHFDFR